LSINSGTTRGDQEFFSANLPSISIRGSNRVWFVCDQFKVNLPNSKGSDMEDRAKFESRRGFFRTTGTVVAAGALAGVAIPAVHAAEDNTIRIALVGCGGRGTGAANNALAVPGAPLKLVAMADVLDDRLKGSYVALNNSLAERASSQIDVPEDRKFISFDGYRHAMDCLNPGDIVLLTTPPAFRWVHFKYAIEKGLNVFMEKPLAVDGPAARRMLELNKAAEEKNLKVGVGLMCRHCEARGELYKRIKDGEIGDITFLQAYRMEGPVATCFSEPRTEQLSELLWQIKRFHSFLWASGGLFSDFMIHNIDECCWMKDAWPVSAKASGGRHYRGTAVDQNFDHYNVEYTFPDGAKLLLNGRNIPGCFDEFASYAHGTKGSAVISTSSHTPAKCRIYKGQQINGRKDLVWAYPPPEKDPYQLEWNSLVQAVRDGTKYNEVKRGVEASVVTAMGRMAAHTGKIITFDDMLSCEHEFAPGVDSLTFESAAPIVANKGGKYPVPMPGLNKLEYLVS
jgi:predicted dehydrogenase